MMKLRSRLLLLPLVALLPAVGLLVWNQWDLNRGRQHEIEQQVLALAKQEAAEVDRIAEGGLQFLVALAQIPDIRDGRPDCSYLLPKIRENYRSYVALIRADLEGNVTCSSIGPGPSIKDRLYFRRALEANKLVTGEFVVGRGTGASSIHFAYPLQTDSGKQTGVIAAALDLRWFRDRLIEKLPPETTLTVTDAYGTILVRIPNNEKFGGQKIPSEFEWIINSKAPGIAQVRSLDGNDQILGYVPIPASSYGFHVGVSRDVEAAFSDLRRAQFRGAALITLGLMLSLGLAALWGEYGIRKPVRSLLRNVERWQKGDYTPANTEPQKSELGEVAVAFDQLVATVSQRERQLQLSEKTLADHRRYLSTVLDRVPAGIMQTLPDKTYAYVNKAFCDLLGRPAEQLIGHKFTEFTNPQDVASDSKLFETALVEKRDYHHRKRYIRPDGSNVITENTVAHLEDGGGLLAVCLDMSERIRTEEMQERLVNELNHRVKNTLATVQALITMSRRYGGSADELVNSFVGRLKALSVTHNLLTEALWEKTSLRALIEAELTPYAGDHPIKVAGPDVQLSPREAVNLGMVLHELATNAAKYGALAQPTGGVSVEWETVNGAGSNPEIQLRWKEMGCSDIKPPTQRGFGSVLIEQSINELGGSVRREYRVDGLTCETRLPLDTNVS